MPSKILIDKIENLIDTIGIVAPNSTDGEEYLISLNLDELKEILTSIGGSNG